MLIKENVSLQDLHTFGIAVKAKFLVEIQSEADLLAIISDRPNTPFLLLGGGSNVIFTEDYEGTILKMEIDGKEVVKKEGETVTLKIGAGENWHQLVLWCLAQNYGGIENLSLIPGTVGAAPIQNIGAYGVELEQIFEALDAINLKTGEKIRLNKEACAFGYRDSVFKRQLKGQFAITYVYLKLRCKNHQLTTSYGAIQKTLEKEHTSYPNIKAISDAVIGIRQSKLPDPRVLGNAGSFFKNPIIPKSTFDRLKTRFPNMIAYPQDEKVKVPAGWLIEQCGWKGKRVGNIGCYEKQALVIVNYGGATGTELKSLIKAIIESVDEKFGIRLTPEVNLIG